MIRAGCEHCQPTKKRRCDGLAVAPRLLNQKLGVSIIVVKVVVSMVHLSESASAAAMLRRQTFEQHDINAYSSRRLAASVSGILLLFSLDQSLASASVGSEGR